MADLDSLVEKTASSLGKVIKKPPLTDKLLRRPPFRFLHDVIMELMRTVGFLEGLFPAEEQDSGNIKDKQQKMDFLDKAIFATAFTIGKSLSAKSSKIVAGHDPENTNVWLQAMAYAVRKKLDSSAAVQRVLAGEKPASKSSKSKSSAKDEEGKSARKSKGDASQSSGGRGAEEGDASTAKTEASAAADDDAAAAQAEAEAKKAEAKAKAKAKAKAEAQAAEAAAAEAQSSANAEAGRPSGPADEAAEPEVTSRPRSERPPSADHRRAREPSARPMSRRDVGAANPPSGDLGLPTTEAPEAGDAALPGNVVRSVRQRPSSARPAPPRQKQAEGTDSGSRNASAAATLRAGQAAGIISAGQESDDDDDGFMVQQGADRKNGVGAGALPGVGHAADEENMDEDGEGREQGALMRKIMEKKAQQNEDVTTAGPTTQGSTNQDDAQLQLERQQAEKEVLSLQMSVQTLCRCANPLGRIIDYIQEDVDSMRKELLQWREEYQDHAAALNEQERETEGAIEPLKAELADYEQRVRDKRDAIANLKVQLLDNEQKLQRLMMGVAASN